MLTFRLFDVRILLAFVNVNVPLSTSGFTTKPTEAFFAAPAPVIVKLYNGVLESIVKFCAALGTVLLKIIVPPIIDELAGRRYKSSNVVPPPLAMVIVPPDMLNTLP